MKLKAKPKKPKTKIKTSTVVNCIIEVDVDEMKALALDLETLMGRIEGYAFSHGAKITSWDTQFHKTEQTSQESE